LLVAQSLLELHSNLKFSILAENILINFTQKTTRESGFLVGKDIWNIFVDLMNRELAEKLK